MKKFLNYSSIIGIVLTIFLTLFCLEKQIFTSPEELRAYLMQFELFAPLLFMIIQISQVVFPIIPGGLTCVAGVICFGPVWGFIYNYISICIGSCINFLLVRTFGKPLIRALSSPKTYDKYIGWLDKGEHFETLFAIAIFLPVAPDDFLCMLAGLTNMTLKKFISILVFCKPPSILLYSMGLTTLLSQFTKFFIK